MLQKLSFKAPTHTVKAYKYYGKQAPSFYNEKKFRLQGSATVLLPNTSPWY